MEKQTMNKFEKLYEEIKSNLNENKSVSEKDLLKAFGKEIEEEQAKEVLKLMKYPSSPKKAEANLERIDKLIRSEEHTSELQSH